MDKKNIIIRKARLDDTGDMFQIDEICFSLPWSEDAFFNEIECNPNAHYYVAESDGSILGYIGYWEILDEAHITNVAVKPEYRTKGIGRMLIKKVIDAAKKTNLYRLTLEVRVTNLPAKKLYSSFGFLEAGIRPKYYIDNGEDAIIMWLEI